MAWTALINTLDRDILLLKTDSTGNELWQQTYGVSGLVDNGERIRKLSDGNYIIAGTKCLGPSVNDNCKGSLLKIDASGIIIWDKFYGSYPALEFFEVYELLNGFLSATGSARILEIPNTHAGVILNTSPTGDSLWMKSYNFDTLTTGNSDYTWSFIPTSDDGFLLAGQTNPGPTGTQDAWLLKVDSMGCFYPGCMSVGLPEIPSSFVRENILLYPNPTSAFSNIILPPELFNMISEIEIKDITGKEVYKDYLMGTYSQNSFPLRTGNFSKGVYIVKVKAEGKDFTAKLLKY